jgi:hypothetical protein
VSERRLRVITPSATPEEVAAIVAALAVVEAEQMAAAAAAAASGSGEDAAAEWVRASRITARRGAMTRGSWRLSGRVARRSRA